MRPFPGERINALVALTPIREVGNLVLANVRDRRHVGGRERATKPCFRTSIATILVMSLNSFGWQSSLLYLLIIGSSNTLDWHAALKEMAGKIDGRMGVAETTVLAHAKKTNQ